MPDPGRKVGTRVTPVKRGIHLSDHNLFILAWLKRSSHSKPWMVTFGYPRGYPSFATGFYQLLGSWISTGVTVVPGVEVGLNRKPQLWLHSRRPRRARICGG